MIIDDEPIACKGMEEYIIEVEFLSLVNVCDNAVKAYAFLNSEKVDLIFLDIEMPKKLICIARSAMNKSCFVF